MGNCCGSICLRGEVEYERLESNILERDFGSLPAVPLLNIFDYLPAEDLCRCGMVNKMWNEMAGSHELWKKRCEEQGLFDEGDLNCKCDQLDNRNNTTYSICELKDHFSRYMEYKRSFHKGNFKSYVLQSTRTSEDVDRLSTYSHCDGKRLVVGFARLEIWNLTSLPKIVFQSTKFGNVTDAKILDDILVLIEESPDSIPSAESYVRIYVYQCVPVDYESETDEIEAYSYPNISDPDAIKLVRLHKTTVTTGLINKQWYLSSELLCLTALKESGLIFFDVWSGELRFREHFPLGNNIVGGLFVKNMFFYIVTLDLSWITALETVHGICCWEKGLRERLPLSWESYLSVWDRKSLIVIANTSITVFDQRTGETLLEYATRDMEIVSVLKPLSESCRKLVNAFEMYKKHFGMRESPLYFVDFVISPFESVLFHYKHKLLFVCGKPNCSGEVIQLSHEVARFDFLKDRARCLSRKLLVILYPYKGKTCVFRICL